MLAEIGRGCIDPFSRVLPTRVLEKELAKRGEQELDELFKYVESLSASYREKLSSNTVDQRDLDTTVAENLRSAKTILIDTPAGQYLTSNCKKCHVTCHNPYQIPNDEMKVDYDAMDRSMPKETRTCTICLNKCIWTMHSNEEYRRKYVREKQVTSSGAIK
jgi:hypothetical protein